MVASTDLSNVGASLFLKIPILFGLISGVVGFISPAFEADWIAKLGKASSMFGAVSLEVCRSNQNAGCARVCFPPTVDVWAISAADALGQPDQISEDPFASMPSYTWIGAGDRFWA